MSSCRMFGERGVGVYLVIGPGDPRVHQGHPYPYPEKPLPFLKGAGFDMYGSGVSGVLISQVATSSTVYNVL